MSVRVCSCSTALALVLAATALSARAQETPPAPPQEGPANSVDSVFVDDIIVTARKRAENVQDIPIAMSAFSGESIAARGIDKLDGLTTFIPNLSFQNNPSFGGASSSAAIYIRGIGQKEFLPTTEPGVGVYVDGVYVARSVGALLDLVDVERVEVLRGPQGTLFGRNTIGGAMSVTTVKPNDVGSMSGQVTVGDFNRVDGKTTLNVPLSDTVFTRVSVATMQRDGYVTRTSDNLDMGDVNTKTGRVQLRWKPADNFEVNLALEGTDDRSNGPALTLSGINYSSKIYNPGNLPVLPPGSAPRAGYYVANPPYDAPTDNFALLSNYFATYLSGQPCISGSPYNPQGSGAACYNNSYISDTKDAGTGPQYSRNALWGASGTVDWDLGPIQLKSITAYRDLDGSFARDGDHSPLTITHYADTLTDKQFSQELQLLGTTLGDSLKYVFGVYYLNEEGNNVNTLDFTPVNFTSGGQFTTTSYAAFGQATWTIWDRFDITGGLRYTKDEKTFLPDQLILVDKTGGALIAANPNTDRRRILPYQEVALSEDAVTPLINLAWRPTDDVMAYVSYSQGFKSGGFVQRVFPPLTATPKFDSETATSYEAGFKSQFLEHAVTLNGAVFFTQYDNLQVQVFEGVAPVTKNAAAAEIKGAELETRLSPGGGWFIEGSVGYLEPKYTEIDPIAVEITKSSKFERVSKWSLSASILKSFNLADGGQITPRVDWSYRSGFYMDALNTKELYQEGYSVINANVVYDLPGGQISVVGGATNIGDENYTQTGIYGSSFGIYEKMYARPREWYLTVKWKL